MCKEAGIESAKKGGGGGGERKDFLCVHRLGKQAKGHQVHTGGEIERTSLFFFFFCLFVYSPALVKNQRFGTEISPFIILEEEGRKEQTVREVTL